MESGGGEEAIPTLIQDEEGQAGRRGRKGRPGGENSMGEGTRGAPSWGGSQWSSCTAARLPRDGDLALQWLPEDTTWRTDPSRYGEEEEDAAQPGQLQREARKQRCLRTARLPPGAAPTDSARVTAPAGLHGPGQPCKGAGPDHPGCRSCLRPSRPSYCLDPETWALSGMAPKRMDFKDVWYLGTRTVQHSDQRRASSQNLSTRVHSSTAPAARRQNSPNGQHRTNR